MELSHSMMVDDRFGSTKTTIRGEYSRTLPVICAVSGTRCHSNRVRSLPFDRRPFAETALAYQLSPKSLGIPCRRRLREEFSHAQLNALPEPLSVENPAKSGSLPDSRSEPFFQ